MVRFEILPHTADKEIRAFGGDLKELFENAAYGMFSLMTDIERYSPTECRKIEVEGIDYETLLHNWLAELNYLFEVDRILFVDFTINEMVDGKWPMVDDGSETEVEKSTADYKLKAVARGVPFGPEIEWLGPPVKAVTYGGLTVRQTDDHWQAQVIFDV